MPAFKRLLCPIDFSACSGAALTAATDLAARSDAALVVVHVWHASTLGNPDYPSPDLIRTMVDDADRAMADCIATAKAAGVKSVESRLINGQAWDEIVKLLEVEPSFDLVVVGTRGRSGLTRLVLGSVAEKVVRHAPCAVLVVRVRSAARNEPT